MNAVIAQARQNLQADLSVFQHNEQVLTEKIRKLQVLLSKMGHHLESFEQNLESFRTLHNPASEWAGQKRTTFDHRMTDDTLSLSCIYPRCSGFTCGCPGEDQPPVDQS
ncbi:hypothetical protein QS257_02475 [Terrilactibacillus sp. S3-3]|nr:hypothetical protein QS257_02475 [Terrilactibacillus sp. S3-3]